MSSGEKERRGREEKACEIFSATNVSDFWWPDYFGLSACRDALFGKVSKSDVFTRDEARDRRQAKIAHFGSLYASRTWFLSSPPSNKSDTMVGAGARATDGREGDKT